MSESKGVENGAKVGGAVQAKNPTENKLSNKMEEVDEEEQEMINAAKALQKFLNTVSNPNVVDMEKVLKAALSYQYIFVDQKTINDPFIKLPDVDIEVEDWLRNVYEWKTYVGGSEGGVALFYSATSGYYYYFVVWYNKNTEHYSVGVYKLERAAVTDWMVDGYFNLDKGTAVQLW